MDDQELTALLKEREQKGMDELLRRHSPLLRYIIQPILEDPREREECLSDVTMLVWNRIANYNPEKGTFVGWLSTLTRNTALNRRRDGQRGCRRPEELDQRTPDPAPGPEEALLQKERVQHLQGAIDRLGTAERSLFYRKYYYMQSTAQIAAELGMSERAVEGRLRRLRLRLRKELEGELDD